jgi:hypothetical protein
MTTSTGDELMKIARRNSASWWLSIGVCCLAFTASAAGQTIDDAGEWNALFAQGDVKTSEGEKAGYKWWFDGHLRLFDDADGFGQSIVRPGLGYVLSDKSTVWGGYAWIRTSPATGADFDEHRAWQQLTWSEALESAKLDFRSRLEQRFVETGSDTGWRFRQLVALRRPFQMDPRFTFVVWDEVFLNVNDTDWGARDGFDQNRAFIGFGWKPDAESTWRIETGYLHQFVNRPSRDDLSNHILSINLFWNP